MNRGAVAVTAGDGGPRRLTLVSAIGATRQSISIRSNAIAIVSATNPLSFALSGE